MRPARIKSSQILLAPWKTAGAVCLEDRKLGILGGTATGKVKTAEGAVEYAAPQVRDTPEPFISSVRAALAGRTRELERLAVELYARGLSTRDIEVAFTDETGRQDDQPARTAVRRGAAKAQNHPQRLRRKAGAQTHVRRAHPRRRALARPALHRVRAAPDRRRQKGTRPGIRGLDHAAGKVIPAPRFQQIRALTTHAATSDDWVGGG